MSVKFETGQENTQLMNRIVDRAVQMQLVQREPIALMMDLAAVHKNDTQIDFIGLLGASDSDFTHDILGIQNNINRSTGMLINEFLPRLSVPDAS